MDALALELAQSIGSSLGPSLALRAELRSLLNLQTLVLHLELCETPYRVIATTPNILDLEATQNAARAWQVTLTQVDESTGWEPLNKSNRDFAGSSNSRPTPTLYHRLSDDGILHLRIKILDSGIDELEIGAIAATATPEMLTNLQLLRTIERLAVALSKHSSILLDFNTTVGNALFGTLHPQSPTNGGNGSINFSEESEDDDSQTLNSNGTGGRSNSSSLSVAGGILSIWTHGFRLHSGDGGGNRFFPHPFSINSGDGQRGQRQVTAGLTFIDPIDEAQFQRWHARHMFQFDIVALIMCVLFHTLLVFTSIGRIKIYTAVATWRWAVGYIQVILLLFLSTKRGKKLYIRNRDAFLLGLLAIVLWYHHFVIRNFHGVASVLQECSGVVYGFLWIPFITLVLQARFKWLLPAIVTMTAINLTLLPEICAVCDTKSGKSLPPTVTGMMSSVNAMRRCSGRGASKVAILVGAALCTVYCVEWRARRVWAALRGPSR